MFFQEISGCEIQSFKKKHQTRASTVWNKNKCPKSLVFIAAAMFQYKLVIVAWIYGPKGPRCSIKLLQNARTFTTNCQNPTRNSKKVSKTSINSMLRGLSKKPRCFCKNTHKVLWVYYGILRWYCGILRVTNYVWKITGGYENNTYVFFPDYGWITNKTR